MARMPSRRTLLVVGGLVMAAVVTAAVIVAARDDAPPAVEVQLLALNDFHGNLEPPSGSSGRIGGVEAGGVEFLATQLRLLAEEAARPDTITVAAGDLIGASPLLSAAFHDEPTAEALGLAGLDLASVGNHEFDDGSDELLRIQNGGCHRRTGAPTRRSVRRCRVPVPVGQRVRHIHRAAAVAAVRRPRGRRASASASSG